MTLTNTTVFLTKMKLKILTIISSITFLSSCANMPTASSQIAGSYTSGIQYENFDLERLQVEFDSLSRRESQLVIAQEQRVKSSQTQAFWLGYGQGDGIEAAELAQVRGEKAAVQKAIAIKKQERSKKEK